MTTEKESLNYFGKFLMENFRDRALFSLEKSLTGAWKNDSFREFQDVLSGLSNEQRSILAKGFEHIISSALHDFLFNIQEENDFENRIKVLVDGYDIVKISDGIHGEQYGDSGWIKKFSKYKNIET